MPMRTYQFLLQLCSSLDGLTRFPISYVQCFGHFGEFLINMHLLQTTTVGSQPLIQWNSVTFGVLPVGHAWRHFPLLLLFDGNLTRRWMKDRSRRRRWPSWDFRVDFESGRFHGIGLCFDHADNALLGSRIKVFALLWWCVPDELGRRRFFDGTHRQWCGNFLIGNLFQSTFCGFGHFGNGLIVRAL